MLDWSQGASDQDIIDAGYQNRNQLLQLIANPAPAPSYQDQNPYGTGNPTIDNVINAIGGVGAGVTADSNGINLHGGMAAPSFVPITDNVVHHDGLPDVSPDPRTQALADLTAREADLFGQRFPNTTANGTQIDWANRNLPVDGVPDSAINLNHNHISGTNLPASPTVGSPAIGPNGQPVLGPNNAMIGAPVPVPADARFGPSNAMMGAPDNTDATNARIAAQSAAIPAAHDASVFQSTGNSNTADGFIPQTNSEIDKRNSTVTKDANGNWVPLALGAAGGLLGAAGSVASGLTQADAQVRAAQIASDSTDKILKQLNQQSIDTNAINEKIHNESRADTLPYRNAGVGALGDVQADIAGYKPFDAAQFNQYKDPGFDFSLSQGLKAIQHSAAARGQLLGGNTMKDMAKYAIGASSSEFNNAFARSQAVFGTKLNASQGLAGVGQTAVGQSGASGQNYANNAQQAGQANSAAYGNVMSGNANAQAAGVTGAANANASMYTGVGNAVTNAMAGAYNNSQSQAMMDMLMKRMG